MGRKNVDIINKYFETLKMCKENINEIQKRDNVSLPEYENLYLYIFCSILCITSNPINIKDNNVILSYDNQEYLLEEFKIKNILKESYDNIINRNILLEETKNEEKIHEKNDQIINPEKIEKNSNDNYIIQEKEENINNKILFDEESTDDILGRNEFKQIVDKVIEDIPNNQKELTQENNLFEKEISKNEIITKDEKKFEFIEDSDPYKRPINHFIFTLHNLKIQYNNGIETSMKLLIYPTTIENNKRPAGILAVIIQNERIKMAYTSQNSTARSLEIIFDDCGYYVSGYWEDGKFKTRVSENSDKFKILNDDIFENAHDIIPNTFGKVLKMDNYNMELEFYPLNTSNNIYSGLVPSVAIKRTNNEEEIILPEDDLISIATEGKYVQIETYWMGDDYIVFEKR